MGYPIKWIALFYCYSSFIGEEIGSIGEIGMAISLLGSKSTNLFGDGKRKTTGTANNEITPLQKKVDDKPILSAIMPMISVVTDVSRNELAIKVPLATAR